MWPIQSLGGMRRRHCTPWKFERQPLQHLTVTFRGMRVNARSLLIQWPSNPSPHCSTSSPISYSDTPRKVPSIATLRTVRRGISGSLKRNVWRYSAANLWAFLVPQNPVAISNPGLRETKYQSGPHNESFTRLMKFSKQVGRNDAAINWWGFFKGGPY